MKKLYYLKIYILVYSHYFINKSHAEEITILLEKINLKENNDKKIFVFNNIQKISNAEKKNQYFHFETPQEILLEYSVNEKRWYLNKKKLQIHNLILFSSEENHILYKENMYDNSLKIILKEDHLYLMHTTELENYVSSVVLHEIYPGWPDAALEAAAITARTYALYKKIESEKRNRLFHIKSSIEHQKYNGISENDRVKKAVQKTDNIIITYNDNPILAMYHVCCGGILPIDCQGYDFIKHPYLKRKKKCTGCEPYKKYFWETSISEEDFCKNMEKTIKLPVKKIKKITRTQKAKSGAIRRIEMLVETKKSKNYPIKLNNKQLRKILNIQLWQYSSHFKITKDENLFKIEGRGHGHHIGLCQRGMFGYSKSGESAEEILLFYYPGTIIKKHYAKKLN